MYSADQNVLLLTQHDHLKTGQRNNFMKNGFQIRIQHSRISFGANFQNFLTILRLKILRLKIEAHILRGPSKAKTACATCQPPVVLRSPNLRRSYSIIRLYHHTKGKVHTISPSCSIRGGGTFSNNYPPPIPTVCMENVYRRRASSLPGPEVTALDLVPRFGG